ncbi:MAG: class I SAM-dependent methyltransferase [Candidatus Thermoplasmatota archaeon]|nr:class I SAM-dependent methyltransferase [Candidatus Thermoplasmatota archaeon]
MKAAEDWLKFSSYLSLRYDRVMIWDEFQPILQHVRAAVGNRDYWQVSENELFDLYCIARLSGARKVVETGVGPGTSSFSILSAMRMNSGRLYSIDLGKKYGEADERPVGFVVPDTLRSLWSLNIGSSRNLLPALCGELNGLDLFFHDSEHTYENVMFELNTVLPHMRTGSFIVIDNYDWTDAPKDFAENHGLNLLKTHDDMCIISGFR